MRPFFIVFLATVISAHAQGPQVPHKMEVAGMILTIRDDARKEIQKDVNALTQSPRHHNIKVERAKTYFPIIEKVFEEERVPDDFKYLVLQESALIADAVSVSNAVGFWQFKDFTAVEMGLRVDKEIDERLNIVSSTRAAARYIKKNNFYFNNWIFALQAYQMGAGGAMKSLPKNMSGVRQMEINSSTYWYVKKFLAHKVAFEDAVKGEGQIKAIPYVNNSKKSLADVAREVSVAEDEIKQYNKWAKKGSIPDDRAYTVIIPVIGEGKDIHIPETVIASAKVEPAKAAKVEPAQAERIKINGIKAIKAMPGETAAALAARARVKVSDFLSWNDISRNTALEPDQYYLLAKKRSRAEKDYHQVSEGEHIWDISQQYGVRIKKLRRYNRMNAGDDVKPGMTLWLSARKPKDADEPVNADQIIEVDNSSTFAWTAESRTTSPSEPEQKNPVNTVEVQPVADASPVTEVVTTPDSTLKSVDSVKTLQPENTASIEQDTVQPALEKVKAGENKTKEHIVKPKETLYGIAHTYNVGVMDLVNWNNLNIQDGIRPGQVLKLTDGEASEEPFVAINLIEHEVRTTDTLYSIARKYGVTIKQLMEWNGKTNFSLAVGEKLKIQAK